MSFFTISSFNSPPVDRIPNEIFRTIIQYCYTPEPPHENHEEYVSYLPLLTPPLTASHVCRSWRKALLSDPTMWSTILVPTFKPCAIFEFMRRSKLTPLNVYIKLLGYSRSFTPAFFSAVFQEVHRFKSLRVRVNISPYFRTLDSSVQQVLTCLQRLPAPELQTFFFSSYNSFILYSPTFLTTLFLGRAPNLKHISHDLLCELPEVTCPLLSSNLSNLSITLSYQPADADLDHLLRHLESSPCLRTLYICNSQEWPYHVQELPLRQSERTVHLPHLQTLVVKTHHLIGFLDRILGHVRFPQGVQWNIVVTESTQSVFPIKNKDKDEQDSESYGEAIRQFLFKARFTSVDIITMAGEEHQVELILMETDGINETDGNKFVFQYENQWRFPGGWDSIVASIDLSAVARLQLIVSFYGPPQPNCDRLERVFHSKIAYSFGPLVRCTIIYQDKNKHK